MQQYLVTIFPKTWCSNVLAYTINRNPPLPYRLKSFQLQIPTFNISSLLPDSRFIRAMRDSRTWQTITRVLFTVRTWARRTIWGDRVSVCVFPAQSCHILTLAALPAILRSDDNLTTDSSFQDQRCTDNPRCQRNCGRTTRNSTICCYALRGKERAYRPKKS